MRSISRAFVLSVGVVAVLAAGVAAAARTRAVRVLDKCEPVTFNFFVAPGTCTDGGNITFGRFLDALLLEGGHPAWKFAGPSPIRAGDALAATNQGGEFHTFTEVAAFGPGVVPDLNVPLGLPAAPPIAECANPATFNASSLPPGASLQVTPGTGTHLFQCCIHPWMQLAVEVQE
ncbi:MAG: cupredoxin domain-containing protein [Candidatus Binatia bacterium]